ncbi:MAG: AAA family ATPase [Muribaculaceae bacterium]|nr:AAA family ATPase [Muribaculaceae bacterium]
MEQFRRFPAGVQDFKRIREDGFVYIDKTQYVYDLANRFGDAIFLSRPRRFGKSLLCSTLKYYFQGEKELFSGLAIEKLEKNWTRHPVLHFDMSNCKSDNLQYVADNLAFMLSRYEEEYNCPAGDKGFGERLRRLIIHAHELTGNRVVLIFDEYDSPVLNVIDNREKMDAIRSLFNDFYGPVKSMAEHLRFAFLTGITKFSQMSIFSTINNLTNISLDADMEGLCGITAQELEENFRPEIEKMAVNYKVSNNQMLQMLRDKYDGYHFGPQLTDIYNPFSLVNMFRSLSIKDYWFASATPAALIKILNMYNFRLSDLETVTLFESDFDQPFDNMASAIPILYQSGYLTIKDYDRDIDTYTLGIPNQEVYAGLYRTLMPLYLSHVPATNTTLLREVKTAIFYDDINRALEAVKNYMAALPYDLGLKNELDFERTLFLIFTCLGIETLVEVKNARGRCDVVIKGRNTIYVLELKIDSKATVDDALAQINERNYLIPYWNDTRRKVKVGVVVDPEARTIKQWKAENE